MKKMNKLLALVLAMVMVLGLAASAFAEGETESTTTCKITAPEGGHTYEIYQIFTGDLKDKVLSNVKWGKNGTGIEGEAVPEATLQALAAVNSESDTAKLAVISQYVTLNAENKYGTVAAGASVEVPAGYYLIKDVDGSLDGENDAYTLYIVQIVGDITINPKSEKPTIDKQVHDETTDAETGAVDGWGETADHAINETFQFKLIATLPNDNNLNAYDSYKLVFTDKMSAGVTFENIVSVTATNSNGKDIVYNCTATEGQNGGNWTLTIADLKEYVTQLPGTVVTVIYNAHLNENAVIENGTPRNANTVGLEYSNNPNWSGEGEEELGKTPEDTVWVFTYKVDNTKYANEIKEENVLAGAGFKLYTDEACNNEYPLIEDSGKYRPVKGDEVGVEMISGADGKFNIVGLDAGTYYLKETTTPEGYNTCAVIKVVISATHSETEAGNDGSTTITMTLDGKAADKNDVVNKSGSTLPETGGIGTTIFYVLGGMLVVCAVVLMVSKKRMSAEG